MRLRTINRMRSCISISHFVYTQHWMAYHIESNRIEDERASENRRTDRRRTNQKKNVCRESHLGMYEILTFEVMWCDLLSSMGQPRALHVGPYVIYYRQTTDTKVNNSLSNFLPIARCFPSIPHDLTRTRIWYCVLYIILFLRVCVHSIRDGISYLFLFSFFFGFFFLFLSLGILFVPHSIQNTH